MCFWPGSQKFLKRPLFFILKAKFFQFFRSLVPRAFLEPLFQKFQNFLFKFGNFKNSLHILAVDVGLLLDFLHLCLYGSWWVVITPEGETIFQGIFFKEELVKFLLLVFSLVARPCVRLFFEGFYEVFENFFDHIFSVLFASFGGELQFHCTGIDNLLIPQKLNQLSSFDGLDVIKQGRVTLFFFVEGNEVVQHGDDYFISFF